MTYGEAVVLTALAFYAAAWFLTIFLLTKLYEWRFPAPFWNAIDRAWTTLYLLAARIAR